MADRSLWLSESLCDIQRLPKVWDYACPGPFKHDHRRYYVKTTSACGSDARLNKAANLYRSHSSAPIDKHSKESLRAEPDQSLPVLVTGVCHASCGMTKVCAASTRLSRKLVRYGADRTPFAPFHAVDASATRVRAEGTHVRASLTKLRIHLVLLYLDSAFCLLQAMSI